MPMFSTMISIHASAKEATDFVNTNLSPGKFQSTPPRRRRRCFKCIGWQRHNFNPRLREGGDFVFLHQLHHLLKFQSTPPRRRRLRVNFADVFHDDFNPRLREGGDRHTTFYKTKEDDFNPRLREGGDTMINVTGFPAKISIHASAKEATFLRTSNLI